MREKLTAVFRKSKYGYIGYLEELPGANTQGKFLKKTKRNLLEAIQLVLEANRQMTEEDRTGVEVIKEEVGEVTVLSAGICEGLFPNCRLDNTDIRKIYQKKFDDD